MKFIFKIAYTPETQIYSFDDNITINEFLIELRIILKSTTNLEDYEIVEAGQYDNENGRDPELAPAITPSDTITIGQKYVNYSGFYIVVGNQGSTLLRS